MDPPILFEDGYGQRLVEVEQAALGAEVALWWASSGWKVAQSRKLPAEVGAAVEVGLARNEREAAQLIVRPARTLEGFIAEAGALVSDSGAVLAAANVEVLRVRYVNVEVPTDSTSVAAPWPDPLPPFKSLITLEAGVNQPLWLRVHAPRETLPGVYRGFAHLRADGYEANVPLRVEVYDFTLPDRLTCRTAFGFNPSAVAQYHRPKTQEERRLLIYKYYESMRDHHISPYDPAPFSKIAVEWVKRTPEECAGLPEEDAALLQEHALTPRFDWEAWDAEVAASFERFHFSSIRLGIPGMGGGTFYGHGTPSLQGFDEGSRGYWLAFSQYCQTLETHLREKGWLDKAFVYWFDEPAPRDHDFVRAGFDKLKRAAPGLNRFITNNMMSAKLGAKLAGGPNMYCSLPKIHIEEFVKERQREGDIFWWYLCTVPKVPYCGLFTDHAGTELRVVFWQMWKRDVRGFLVWASNLWTTGCAYPNHPQNPYEDAMSWVSGYGTKKGERRPWGNGDGRFMYPPEAAATADSPTPVLDGPVDSIRWEMIRDGLEDYEYLVILKGLLAEKSALLSATERNKYDALLRVPGAISEDPRHFTKDPAPIEKQRHSIAQAIEVLQKVH